MKKIMLFIMCLLFPCLLFADTKELNIYLFKGETCPHCIDLTAFLNDYVSNHDSVILNEYEVWNNEENANMLDGVKEITGVDAKGVPYLVIGEKVMIGYNEANNEEIINYINYYQNNYFDDKVGRYILMYNDSSLNEEELTEDGYMTLDEIVDYSTLSYNIKKIINKNSNFVSSVILGLISSFNFSFIFIVLIFICILLLYKDTSVKIMIGIIFMISYVITNFIYVYGFFDSELLLDKTPYIRIILSTLLMIYCMYKIIRFIYKSDKKYNKVYLYIFLFIIFILIDILSIYSNIDVPSIFKQIILDNRVFNSIIYSLFGIVLFSFIFILCIELSRMKLFKSKYNYFYLIGCVIILILSCIVVSYPSVLF